VRSWSGRACRCWSGIGAAGLGEIDIIAAEAREKGVTLVFSEMKCRAGLAFGPLEVITFAKMQTLRQLAALCLRDHQVKASTIRLDAIGVALAPSHSASLAHVGAVG
jgi:putative endonuclease